jgi:protein-S-isoprenylcysteine O-methyltransferase Ste14
MPLTEEFVKSGSWLFRRRSYLPIFLLAVIAPSLAYFRYPLGDPALERLWEVACLAVSIAGLAIRGLAAGYAPKGTSGRNAERQMATTLNTQGMYSLVRHPLYLGNFVIGLGVFLFLRVWWVALIFSLAFALYYERIMFAEEAFLRERFGRPYVDWASRTPAFLPRFGRWRRPDLPFSFRTALKREYPTALGIVASMFLLKTLGESRLQGRLVFDPIWTTVLAAGLVFYLVVRIVHKKTTLLRVEGR